MSRFLRYLACLFMLIFVGNALAAGYTCPTYKKYTSCKSGYYMTASSSSSACNTTPAAGNACRPCSTMGSNYTCSGGTACPKLNSVTCSAGYYLPANATSCSACGGNNYYCPGGTFNVSSSAQGRNTVSSGYYSTGGTSTTRTGQSQCGGNNYYCSGGVRNTVSSGYYSTGGTSTTRTGQSQCTGATYCSSGVQYSCPSGYTANTTAGKTAASACQISVAGGKYVGTANSATLSTCAAGTYKAAHTVNYGSTSSCSACTGRTKYSGAGASACSTVTTGYYTTGCNTSNNNCTGQTKCEAGTYCVSGVQNDCPDPETHKRTTFPANYYNPTVGRTGLRTWESGGDSSISQCGAQYTLYSTRGTLFEYASYNPDTEEYDVSTLYGWYAAKAGYYLDKKSATGGSYQYYDDAKICPAGSYCPGAPAMKPSVDAPEQYGLETCPTGYPNSAAQADAITQCYSNTKSREWTGTQTACAKPTGCYSVTCNACSIDACDYVAYSNTAGTGDGTVKSGCETNNAACQQTLKSVTANAGRYVSGLTCPACSVGTYQGTNGATVTSCSVCSGNTYAASEGTATCSSCPTSYTISGTSAADHDAKSDCKISCAAGTQVATADGACTTPASSWYTSAHTVAAGSTSGTNVKACLTNYATPLTQTRTDHDASTDCKISCAAGTRIASANATSCTTPSGNWYVGAHTVSQGSTSSVNSCLTNYTISGTTAANHDEAADCKITCDGGSYIATANNTSCTPVGAGYWATESIVSQGSVGIRNACEAGLTTIGSGKGADEAGDCGRILNVNGEKVYLRSDKKTTPSLNVSISGKTFYGNMGTSYDSPLKIKSGTTTYSVYDDSDNIIRIPDKE